ncbi:biotin--[acetyl-CoA-carboxylase] ligase [Arthrobacter cavernae]|uniref:biotin--[biotin carboxyl-carrier protein] ligase n=1 Tax=Arthrobacter cavernae TaxID=2817681 RepID=A0A939HFM7_9MICC|nr:biotin--[acetyl-CoA-carboxylase] ligase [Arthrobacter cavernae]MBO1266438.1 biotin--[acetyl-CoA-carboxylase] ligase [Arthrobacter cavernae]
MDAEQPASSEPRTPRPELDRPALDRDALLHADLLSATGISRLDIVESTGSTNADLVRAVAVEPEKWTDLAVLTAEYQTAGRGRLDRQWESPARSAVSVSVVLRPVNAEGLPVPTQSYSWLSLLAAVALREALLETAGLPADIKWPNDVLVRGKKIAGILAQMTPLGAGSVPAVVLGVGLNVTLEEDELPVPTATSMLLEGAATTDRTAILKSYLSRFAALYRSFCNADGDPAAGLAGGTSLHKRVEAAMVTLGREVRAHLPGDHELVGHASRLDEHGSLLVVDHGGREHVVTAGDVVHLRATESGYA